MALRIDVTHDDEIAVLKLDGVLRMGRDTQSLRQQVNQLVEQGNNRIVMNIADLTYIDSGGVSEVVQGCSLAKKNGGIMKLACPTDQIREVLRVTRLLTVLDVHETEREARASFE